mmetsp:Transcript_45945/g.139519  ORF Transcript_45945/g.139519 Transcript_45945/m.139519 type:complete len:103 (-) Transcript_45945:141-449(-)|eukprot:CAMPEP_0113525194 /NCGR_PEP_ID=MMETSP0015_2-20120614/20_1 /TAXON_ID=2838 /ORGANISM="Odontella" /LENGTH=102 /DNA_ID=CAMNT_0000423321 /DNA_START=129 /DNA_END=437 /DNA_ORIENTATION=- /assembly_acc=CAM_ASM_000160
MVDKNEAKIRDLTERITALESSASFEATRDAVREVQMEMLEKLRSVKEAMGKDVAGGGGSASSKEMERLKAENERLTKENAKQAYRIEHLCGSVRELQGKLS